jgi:GNAT superfamily N-acetyltransferase
MTDDGPGRPGRPRPVLVDLPPGDPRWDAAFPVLRQLRPHLDREAFEVVHRAGSGQGLVFTAAFDGEGRCLGVAGWRVVDTTSVLRKLYLDDLVVDADARSGGVGAALLAHLEDRGLAAGCHVLELDSGHQRTDAHRFYRREGYVDRSAHFAKDLGPADGT